MTLLTTGKTKLVKQVCADLLRHEGFREFAYPDVLSKLYKKYSYLPWGFAPAREIAPPGVNWDDGAPWTVGIGFTQGVTPDSRMPRIQAERYLEEKITNYDLILDRTLLTWYGCATFVTKTVLINMMFNLGLTKLLKFRNTLNYMKEQKFPQAAAGMRNSLWYKQVTKRAEELARRIEKQEIDPAHKLPE
jgi:GH24 family phage-related lysozyme (muramidase)